MISARWFCCQHHLRTWSLSQEYSLHTLQPHNGEEPCMYPGRCSKQRMQCSTAGNLGILFDTWSHKEGGCIRLELRHSHIEHVYSMPPEAGMPPEAFWRRHWEIVKTLDDFSLHGWYWTTDSKAVAVPRLLDDGMLRGDPMERVLAVAEWDVHTAVPRRACQNSFASDTVQHEDCPLQLLQVLARPLQLQHSGQHLRCCWRVATGTQPISGFDAGPGCCA